MIINQETKWISSLQLDNGSIPMVSYTLEHNQDIEVNPYFSDLSVLALLQKGKTYQNVVKKYLVWHLSHLNKNDIHHVTGTIYDYMVKADKNGHVLKETTLKVNAKPSYDSTDSYAATFLSVLNQYHQICGGTTYLKKMKSSIDQIFLALQSTYKNGMTYATPSYKVYYLMDNSEVYQGLSDAIKLYEDLFPQDTRIARMKAMRAAIKKNIMKRMYNEHTHLYASALDESLVPFDTSMKIFYMDAVCQFYPLINSIQSPDSSVSTSLYQSFNQHWSTGASKHSWETLDTPDDYVRGDVVYGAALMHDSKRVNTYLKYYARYAFKKRHGYPLYNADIAFVVRAAAYMNKNTRS